MPVPSQGRYSFFRNACTKSGSLQFSVYRLLTDFVILLLHLLDFYQVNITKGVEQTGMLRLEKKYSYTSSILDLCLKLNE